MHVYDINTIQHKVGQLRMNRISVLFFIVDLCFSYLFIHEIDKLCVMCGIPLMIVIAMITSITLKERKK